MLAGTPFKFSTALAVALAVGGCNANGGHAVKAEKAATQPTLATGPRALCAAEIPRKTATDVALAEQARAAAKNPENTEPWLALGATWIQKARESNDPGFYVNADACADAVVAMSPGNRLADDLRGFSRLNDHRFREAREIATNVLATYADDPTAWGTRSDADLELGDVASAEEAVQHMLALKPGLASYGRAAYLRWLRGDVNAAKILSAQAIRAGGEAKDREPLAWSIVQAAIVFWNEGDYAGARAGFDLALTKVPGYAPALVGEGRVALAERRYTNAVTHLEQAYAASPLVETAWLLGDAKRLAGDATGAESAYARVVADGRRHDFRTLSLFFSSRRSNPDEAVRLARAEMQTRPGPYTKDALAWALYRSGELSEARRLADEVVALGVHDARLWYHAGAIRLAAGDVSGKKLVERALAQNPAFDVVESEEARKLVAHDV
jgi:tetratricopeptide (TPR) repeat protein